MNSTFECYLLKLCATLGWPLDELCESLVESYIPQIIDGLVSGNLNPGDVCRSIGLCEADETTHLPDHTTTWWEGGKGEVSKG